MVHRRPDMHAADITRKNPTASNSTSPATSSSRPVLIIATVRPSDHVGVSIPQTKAKKSRKSGAEDLHMV